MPPAEVVELPTAHVVDFAERARELRYIEHRPTYDLLATWLNANGGKSDDGKPLAKSKRFTAEELMPPIYLPDYALPLRLTPGEAKAIMDAVPHLSHASWVLQAFAVHVVSLKELERIAKA